MCLQLLATVWLYNTLSPVRSQTQNSPYLSQKRYCSLEKYLITNHRYFFHQILVESNSIPTVNFFCNLPRLNLIISNFSDTGTKRLARPIFTKLTYTLLNKILSKHWSLQFNTYNWNLNTILWKCTYNYISVHWLIYCLREAIFQLFILTYTMIIHLVTHLNYKECTINGLLVAISP